MTGSNYSIPQQYKRFSFIMYSHSIRVYGTYNVVQTH